MFPLTHTAIQEPKDQTHSTRTAEVYMPWWKGGQHSCGSSNQVCPFGIFLLDDRNGSRVKIMAHKHLN